MFLKKHYVLVDGLESVFSTSKILFVLIRNITNIQSHQISKKILLKVAL